MTVISNPSIHRPGSVALLLAGITFFSLVPFCNKAFHLDDPIFLWPARAILSGEPRPMSVAANWYGYTSTLAKITNHFPLVSAMMTPVVAIRGFSEIALHVQFAIFAAAAVAGVYLLAREFCDRPAVAALLVLGSPAFFVSASTLMSDVPMLAFWVWSLVAWTWARQSGGGARFLISGVLIALAALSKYPGAALVPLLAAAATSRRNLGWQMLALAIPIATLAAVQIFTLQQYRHGLLGIALAYAANRPILGALPRGLFNGLCFVGGSFPAAVILWSFGWTRTQALGAAIGALIAVGGILALADFLFPLNPLSEANRGVVTAHAIVFCLFGMGSLWMAAHALHARRDDSLLLALWVLGVFVFASFANWTTNARSVLPMGPALAILAARSAPVGRMGRIGTIAAIVPIGLSALLSIALTCADQRIANASRSAARHILAQNTGATIWFTGHWGWQWYLEAGGATPVDYERSLLRAGDLLVEHQQNTNVLPHRADRAQLIDQIDIPMSGWVSTINVPNGAHFYTSFVGPLPYVLAPGPTQEFTVYRITRDIAPPK